MKLLVVTQAIDDRDPVLGFFTRWIAALAPSFERIETICLTEGAHSLPGNVRVHSLGKEKGRRSRFAYALGFLHLSFRLRHEYDAVLVHMNQEYVLIGGLLWRPLGKRVYMWRNHGSGSLRTRIAAAFCHKVFYTSTVSYTAGMKNAVRMPVGVDLERFLHGNGNVRRAGSILMVGRVAPKKHVREVIEALTGMKHDGLEISLTLAGPMDDAVYRDEIIGLASTAGIGLSVRGPLPHAELSGVYQEHDIVVNVSEPGMFDKTMLEALASGCLLLTRHEDLARELDSSERTTGDVLDIAEKLRTLIALQEAEKDVLRERGKKIAEKHSLTSLVARLSGELYA